MSKPRKVSRSIFYSSFLTFLLAITLQYTQELIPIFFKDSAKITKLSSTQYKIDTTPLPQGIYSLSMGRVRGLCQLRDSKGDVLQSNYLPGQKLRNSLGFFFDFIKSETSRSETYFLKCEDGPGFVPGFHHYPVAIIAPASHALQTLRVLNSTLPNIIASFFLMFSIVGGFFSTRRKRHAMFTFEKESEDRFLFLFSLAAIFYSISLSHFPRLIFDNLISSVIHIYARIFFVFGFSLLLEKNSKLFRRFIFLAGFGAAACALYVSIKRHDLIDYFQNTTALLFPIISLTQISMRVLNKGKSLSILDTRLTHIAGLWALLGLLDIVTLYTNVGVYLTASTVIVISLSLAFSHREARLKDARLLQATAEALRIAEGNASIEVQIKAIAHILKQYSHYTRMSVYLDAYVLGFHDAPQQRWLRLGEDGYKKNTQQDSLIDFNEGRGQMMRLALESQKPQLAQGRDRAWFSNIPIGPHAIVNLSDEYADKALLAAESHEFIDRCLPALRALSEKLILSGSKMSYALEALRVIKGSGHWPVQIGAIFLDANDFDDSVVTYGDAFVQFFSETYLPALSRYVRKWLVQEGTSRGDGLYFIAIADLIQDGSTPLQATAKGLHAILEFAQGPGSSLCTTAGYDPIRLQIGVAFGEAQLICDELHPRTAGNTVNLAARLQRAAPPGHVLADQAFVQQLPPASGLVAGPIKNELVKKRYMHAQTVTLDRGASAKKSA